MPSHYSAIIIPSLNPDIKLVEYVRLLIKNEFQKVIVINDGSRSECKQIFNQLKEIPECDILEHAVNLGKGRALKNAFNYYLVKYSLQYKGVITVDSDGQHMIEDVVRIDAKMQQNPDALVLGVRDFGEKTVPLKSRFGNKLTKTVMRMLFAGGGISDTQTGLRGFPNGILLTYLDLHGERFEYETQMLIETLHRHTTICEVPIHTIYINGNQETHFRPVADSIAIYKIIFGNFFRYGLSSISSFLLDYGLFCFLNFALNTVAMTPRVWVSSVIARAGSSLYNYYINKTYVFRSGGQDCRTLIRYYLLCVAQMICSAFLTWSICYLASKSEFVVKPIVDVLLFLISFQIQQRWVFAEVRP